MTRDEQMSSLREEMVEHQLKGRGIKDERVLAVFKKIPREINAVCKISLTSAKNLFCGSIS